MLFDHRCEQNCGTTIKRAPNATDECWCTHRKLRLLLGDSKEEHIENLARQQPSRGFGRFSPSSPPSKKHYSFAYTIYMCYLLCYTSVEHGVVQTAILLVLKRIIAVNFAASSVSTISGTSATQICTSATSQNQSESTWRGIDGGTVVVSQPLPTQLNIFRYFDSAGTCPSRTPVCPNHSRQGPKTRDNL